MPSKKDVENEVTRSMSGPPTNMEEYNKQRIPHPSEERTTIPVGTIELGPDGFVKKTETGDASSVVGMLARNLEKLGCIRIIPTEQGVSVEWFSAQPAITLSHFLQALGVDVSSIEDDGVSYSDSSKRGSLDIPDKWAPDDGEEEDETDSTPA